MGDKPELGGVWQDFFWGSLLVFLVLCDGLWTVPPRKCVVQGSLAGKSEKSWVRVRTLPVTSAATWSMSLYLTGLHCLHLSNSLALPAPFSSNVLAVHEMSLFSTELP